MGTHNIKAPQLQINRFAGSGLVILSDSALLGSASFHSLSAACRISVFYGVGRFERLFGWLPDWSLDQIGKLIPFDG